MLIQIICWFAVLNLAVICFFNFIFLLKSVVVWACGVLLLLFCKLLLVYIALDLKDVSFDDINGSLWLISYRFSFFFNDVSIHYTRLLQRVVDLGICQNWRIHILYMMLILRDLVAQGPNLLTWFVESSMLQFLIIVLVIGCKVVVIKLILIFLIDNSYLWSISNKALCFVHIMNIQLTFDFSFLKSLLSVSKNQLRRIYQIFLNGFILRMR